MYDNFIKEKKDIIIKLYQKYPRKFIHPETLNTIIIEFIKKSFIEKKEQSEQFINYLDNIINEPFIHIAPNFSIQLTDNINDFDIGPIKITKSKMIKIFYPEIGINKIKINVSDNMLGFQSFEEEEWKFNLTEFCFVINIACCPKQQLLLITEYINVGISLLRLYILRSGYALPRFPYTDNNDPLPFDKTSTEQKILSFKPNYTECRNIFFSDPRYYTVDKQLKIKLNNSRLNEMAEKILSPNVTPMQNRIYLALKWMSEARQQEDLEEKFIKFFIALESLLIPAKSNNPDSIMRKLREYTSIILCYTSDDREKMKKSISLLYDIRSRISHQGKRYITQQECSILQCYVESVIFWVMEQCINYKEQEFFSSLEQEDNNWNKEALKDSVEQQKKIQNPS